MSQLCTIVPTQNRASLVTHKSNGAYDSLIVSEATDQVIVDDSHSLHVRVADGGADEPEASFP